MTLSDENLKLNEAMRRAVPVSRMVDYGMMAEDALWVHDQTAASQTWVEALLALAERDEHAAKQSPNAAELWHKASVSLVFAQMVDNADTPLKRSLYARSSADFGRFSAGAAVTVEKLSLPFEDGRLVGWHFHAPTKPLGVVIVFGGLSGWATAYRSIAEALCSKGIDCVLADGPGQGESRLDGGIFAGARTVPGFARFVDYLERDKSHSRVGIWGNSFGGLFAAMTAAADARIAACCVNGAPSKAVPPPFRTPREQMAAIFGADDLDDVSSEIASLSFDPSVQPIRCPVLVLEGGADPLVPLGSQHVFREGNAHALSGTLTWADGEHTIYNHEAERNERVATWFADCFQLQA